MSGFSRGKLEAGRNELGLCTARYESKRLLLVCFEGLARLSRRVWRRFVRGSREISLVPSLHRASTDALMKLDLENKIQWKCCIICNMPVFNTNRYREFVVRITEDMNQIKQRERILSASERMKYMDQLRNYFQHTNILKQPKQFLRIMENISDKQLQCEYHIFYAEQSVVRATKGIECKGQYNCCNIRQCCQRTPLIPF